MNKTHKIQKNSNKIFKNHQKNPQNFQKIQKYYKSTFNPNFHFFTKQITKQKCWKIIFLIYENHKILFFP